jgi:hypothetical protein
VLFQKLDKDKYNLAFGDWDKKQRTLDSHIRSNNGDRDKILATVAYSVVEFLNYYEESEIRIMGQSKGKTRLYQMGINKYLEEINFSYSVSGIEKGILEEFRPGKNYEKFFLSKKRKL